MVPVPSSQRTTARASWRGASQAHGRPAGLARRLRPAAAARLGPPTCVRPCSSMAPRPAPAHDAAPHASPAVPTRCPGTACGTAASPRTRRLRGARSTSDQPAGSAARAVARAASQTGACTKTRPREHPHPAPPVATPRPKTPTTPAPCAPTRRARGVRPLRAATGSGPLVGCWRLVPAPCRVGTWDLVGGWPGHPPPRLAPRVALPGGHAAALGVRGGRPPRTLRHTGWAGLPGRPVVVSARAVPHRVGAHPVAAAHPCHGPRGLRRRAAGPVCGHLLARAPPLGCAAPARGRGADLAQSMRPRPPTARHPAWSALRLPTSLGAAPPGARLAPWPTPPRRAVLSPTVSCHRTALAPSGWPRPPLAPRHAAMPCTSAPAVPSWSRGRGPPHWLPVWRPALRPSAPGRGPDTPPRHRSTPRARAQAVPALRGGHGWARGRRRGPSQPCWAPPTGRNPPRAPATLPTVGLARRAATPSTPEAGRAPAHPTGLCARRRCPGRSWPRPSCTSGARIAARRGQGGTPATWRHPAARGSLVPCGSPTIPASSLPTMPPTSSHVATLLRTSQTSGERSTCSPLCRGWTRSRSTSDSDHPWVSSCTSHQGLINDPEKISASVGHHIRRNTV
jgi:hypothetical protein